MANANRTTTPRKDQPRFPTRVALAIALFTITILGIAAYHHWFATPQPHGTVNAADGDPAMVTPVGSSSSPTPESTKQEPSLRLQLDLPGLSDLQLHYLHEVQALPRIPIAFGIDRPPVVFSDNEAVVFTALVFTESSLNPYDAYGNTKWSLDADGHPLAVGICQLTGPLITDETRTGDEANIYAGAAYFRELIDDAHGDLMTALRSYKGVLRGSGTDAQSNSVWSYIRIDGGK